MYLFHAIIERFHREMMPTMSRVLTCPIGKEKE